LGGVHLSEPKEIIADLCILGGGPAGYVAAIRASQLGVKAVLIENREIGGTCLNRGCIPTKALLKTAEALGMFTKSKEFGISSSVSGTDMDIAFARKDRIVKSLRTGLEQLMLKNNIEVLHGKGTIEGAGKVIIKTPDEEFAVNCKKLLITTGSEPAKPGISGINKDGVITSDEALDLKEIPDSVTIIGAGAIGLEFATWFRSLGSKVSVIEMKDFILPDEDKEITTELLKIMKRQGIRFTLGARVKEIIQAESGLETFIETNGQTTPVLSEKVLVATGRKLNSISPDIVSLGVTVLQGAIVVNEHMETNVPNVYAAGDVIGGKLLAHLAFAQGRVAVENAFGMQSCLNENAVPACVYTNPEVASVGLSEEQAKNKGIAVKVGRFDFRNNGRALCHGEREGFVKVVTNSETGVILGAGILGHNASELISELTLAISLGAKAEVLADLIHPHPTLSEAVMEACADAVGRAIHK
jgi:dihydrolipoamide dehydrogenase